MNCHLDFPFGNEIPYHLQWDKDGEMVLSWLSGWEAPRVGEGWGGRVRRVGGAAAAAAAGGALGGGSLNVSAVRETDAGLFRCRVSFPNRSPPARNNGTFYYLDVDGGTVIATPPVNVAVVEGARAELECGAKEPAARVSWLRDGAPLPLPLPLAARPELALPPNGSLVLRAARPEDAGLYECRVQHDAREQSASAYLDVQYKAKVVYAPRERFLSLGKPASLDCHFSANPPLTNLRWEKDGFLFDPYNVPGVFYSRNGSLLFNRVDESHEGQYSCTAYNALGSEGPSPRVRVRVQRPPALLTRPQPLYLARLGQPLALPCAAAPQPHHAPPAVVWTRKDGAPLPADRFVPEEGKLSISAVAEEDRGVLVCTVSNEAADVSAETELLIENLPPRAPHSLTARATAHALHVAWEPGRRGDGAEYTLWYRERAAHEWRTLRLLTRGATEATLAGLRAATPHELRVLAQDSLGDGLFSKPLVVSTLDPDVEDSEAAFVAAVTQAADAAGTGGDEDEDEAGDGEEGGAGRARGRRAAGDDAAAGRRRAGALGAAGAGRGRGRGGALHSALVPRERRRRRRPPPAAGHRTHSPRPHARELGGGGRAVLGAGVVRRRARRRGALCAAVRAAAGRGRRLRGRRAAAGRAGRRRAAGAPPPARLRFRAGRGTLDAVKALRDFSDLAASKGEGVIAVSLDIANAFGTLPFEVIKESLRRHGIPLYLQKIVGHYLEERVVLYDHDGCRIARPIACGVPQGSVLGPLLWNLGFHWAIGGVQLPRMTTICYADDTMVAVRGGDLRETLRKAAVATELVVDRIRALGLQVAVAKMDAIVFGGPGWRLPANTEIRIGGEPVQVKANIKYLGLVLDRKWDFSEHFTRLAPRLVHTASALGRLLPNVEGPKQTCRKLFAGVDRSMALYGAPIWANRLSERNKALLRRPQRVCALRIIRGYVTVAHMAACALAGTLP
ncbi:protein turtle-like [Choristoneura fumiferana]|uniref:protein turtle-like n=1 Tax=Choristoneura fumiferana TaxID=7141 RepID=UPI003D156369